MASSSRRIMGEHNVHRSSLFSPSSARRILSLSVPHTPRLVVGTNPGEDSAVAAEGAAQPLEGKRHGHTRTLSQPVLLSDGSDSDGGKPTRAALHRIPVVISPASSSARASSPAKKQAGVSRNKKVLDRDKYRKALWDEEDDPAKPAWLAMSSRSNGNQLQGEEARAVKKKTVSALRTKIMDEFGRAVSDEQAEISRRGASGRDSAAPPPSGPQKSPRRPIEHRDYLRSRGTSLPVSRANLAMCYDVGGFLCVGPPNLTATTNLREYRGKVVLLGMEDLAYGGRFSSAGACALVATVKDPEAAGHEHTCSKETRIPVVFVSDIGAQGLEHGSLVKILFDVASQSPPPAKTISKNAHYRRSLNGSKEETLPVKNAGALNDSVDDHLTEISADSGNDSDQDAEFYLVRRRRQIRASTPASAKQTQSIDQTHTYRTTTSPAYKAMAEMVSDDDSSISSHPRGRGAPAQQPRAHVAPPAWTSPRPDAVPAQAISAKSIDTMVDEIMQGSRDEILRRVEQISDPSKIGVSRGEFVAAFAARMNQELCSQEARQKLEAILRLRELCKTKSEEVAHKIVDTIIHLPGTVNALWEILGGPSSEQEGSSTQAPSWLNAQV